MKRVDFILGGILGGILLVAVVWWGLSLRVQQENPQQDDLASEATSTSHVQRVMSPKKHPRVATKKRTSRVARVEQSAGEEDSEAVVDAWVEDLPPDCRELGQKIVDASDKEDLEGLRTLLNEARNSSNADVRQRYVEELAWFGQKTLRELTTFLNDKNEDVAQTAVNAWDSAVDEVEDESFRVNAATMAMKVLSSKDALATVVTKIESADNQRLALEALAEIAESQNAAAMESVKEAYEFLTGDEWRDAETARQKALTVQTSEEEEE